MVCVCEVADVLGCDAGSEVATGWERAGVAVWRGLGVVVCRG